MALSLGESRHSLGVTKDELECLKGYETGVSFQEVLRMIPHHPTENSKTEENSTSLFESLRLSVHALSFQHMFVTIQ